ncbi:MAG: glutaminyl-peptide cyclotransferase, partial [Chitinophagaceae bacterium]|nr:glutaminyl-peptide cyclotransferase [Chitinophagaceae bacterium]
MHNRYFRTLLLFTTIVFAVSCNDETETKQPAETISPSTMSAIPEMPVLLVNQYPHKETAYTEGLQFEDGVMYESTGQYGRSYLYKYELGSGKILNEYKLGNEYFGEGMTVWGDTIYMLSYREHTGFLFDKKSFRLLGKFRLNANEGWGLTHDSTHLIYSDGTPMLYFMDRNTFKEVKTIQVTNNYGPIPNINELE